MVRMKKSISFLLLLAVVTAASAQVRFGVKGGLNLTHISFEESEIYDREKGAGFFIGPMVKLSLPIGLGFDVAVLYDQRNAKQRSVGLMGGRAYQTTIKQHQIAVPVNVRYGFGLAKVAELYVFAGPQISFNVGKDVEMDYGDWVPESVTFSINAGLGLLVCRHWQIAANYNIACGKSAEVWINRQWDYAKVVNKSRMDAWQISLGYYF